MDAEPSIDTLVNLALDPNCDLNQQLDLAAHDSPEVRSALASNTALGEDVVWILASDPSAAVRHKLAANRCLADFALETLAEDENGWVAKRAELTLSRRSQEEEGQVIFNIFGLQLKRAG